MTTTIYFVIPAFNEEQNLPRLFDSIHDWRLDRGVPVRLVVVDDGSTDSTAEIASRYSKLPVTLVQHPINLGVHQVFRTAFRTVHNLAPAGEDLIVTLEADNTSSLDILDKMLARAREGNDLVLASCYAPGGGVVGTTPYRKFLSWCANLILRCVPGMPRVYTFSSFYRVYRVLFFNRLMAAYGERLIEMEGFVCVVEMLLKGARLGPRLCEVPMRLDGTRRNGASKMKTLHTIRGYLRLLEWSLSRRLARPIAVPEPAERFQTASVSSGGSSGSQNS